MVADDRFFDQAHDGLKEVVVEPHLVEEEVKGVRLGHAVKALVA